MKRVILAMWIGLCACGGPQTPVETVVGGEQSAPEPMAPEHAVEAIWMGPTATCIKRDGKIHCSGTNSSAKFHTSARSTETMTESDIFTQEIIDMSVSSSSACALHPGGTVQCAGSILWGRRGDGCRFGNNAEVICNDQTVDRTELKPISRVTPLPLTQQIEGSVDATCALTQDGEVFCWGSNIDGELGVEGQDFSTRPLKIAVPKARRLYAGHHHFCALSLSNQVWCWGTHRIDEADNPYERAVLPKQFTSIGEPKSADDVIVTSSGVCVTSGQLTRCVGEFALDETPPVVTENPLVFKGVSDIVTGMDHTCVLSNSGAASCYSSWPHLAGIPTNDANFGSQWREVVLPYKTRVARLVAQRYGTCAVSELGEVACWGARAEVFGIPPVDDEGTVPAPTLMMD